MTFESLGLAPNLLRAIEAAQYTTPTPIQQKAIPLVLTGGDVLGCAQTGTGKTAAFALPILQRLAQSAARRKPRSARVLVLAPTRELAAQIEDNFVIYGQFMQMRFACVFGGVGYQKQVDALRGGVDVLVATPGRLLDLLEQNAVSLRDLEIFVLDEADRMLDMGFIHDVRKVLREIPAKRQTLMFSATMAPEIRSLASNILHAPQEVAVTPVASTARLVEQGVFFVDRSNKRDLLLHLLAKPEVKRVLVFTRTKHGANRIAEGLQKRDIGAAAIHGNKSQGARERALDGFKAGRIRVLVATDIAARGIDVDEVTHVINYEIPNEPESYVHRIGRTGRAGATGIAWSLCEPEERGFFFDIEKTIRARVPVVEDHPFYSPNVPNTDDLHARRGGSGGHNGSAAQPNQASGGGDKKDGQRKRFRPRRRR